MKKPFELMKRYEGNPIITPDALPGANQVYNAGAVKVAGEYVLLMTVLGDEPIGRFHVARSADGVKFEVDPEPAITAQAGEDWICDPRVTFMDGMYYILYWSGSPYGCRTVLCTTQDFTAFERRGEVLFHPGELCVIHGWKGRSAALFAKRYLVHQLTHQFVAACGAGHEQQFFAGADAKAAVRAVFLCHAQYLARDVDHGISFVIDVVSSGDGRIESHRGAQVVGPADDRFLCQAFVCARDEHPEIRVYHVMAIDLPDYPVQGVSEGNIHSREVKLKPARLAVFDGLGRWGEIYARQPGQHGGGIHD